MEVASLELCKKLWELSKWENGTNWHDPKNPRALLAYPRYNLGYLIRKLPEYYAVKKMSNHFTAWDWDNDDKFTDADTPEDACALLCIKLIEEGLLK